MANAAFLILLCFQQDKTTVEDVLKLMEKNTAALKDLTFEIDTREQGAELSESLSVMSRWRRGSGLRVSVVSNPRKKKGAGMGFDLHVGEMEFVYAPDAFYIWLHSGEAKRSIAVTNMRMGWDEPAARSVDPYFLPSGFILRFYVDDPFIYYEIDPRFFFGHEPNLAYEGTRVEDGKTYHVLSSYLTPSDLLQKLHGSEFQFTASRKEFYVAADVGQLARIRWAIGIRQNLMGRESEERGTLVVNAGPRTQVAGGVTLASGATWTFLDEKRGRRQESEMAHTFKNFRANTGVPADAILTEEERSDLYADAALLKPAEYEAIVKKDPKNAVARYSLAIARGTKSFMEQMMGAMGGGDSKETPKILGDFEKLLELRPDAESPVVNFLAAAEAEDAADRAAPLIKKVEEGTVKGDRVRLLVAARLNAKGEYDRALKLLEKAPSADGLRRRAVLERMLALAAKKDSAALLTAFEEEARRRTNTSDQVIFIREIESKVEALPKDTLSLEEAGKLLQAAQEKSPDTLVWRLALARLSGKVPAIAALVEAAPADGAVIDFALELVADRAEFTKEDAQRLRDAMAKVKTSDPRVPYQLGRALLAADLKADALKEFDRALETCAALKKAEPAAAYAGAVLFDLAAGEHPGETAAWLERIVAAILQVAPHGEGVPTGLLYNSEKNPVNKLAQKHIADKRWVDLYRLATEAGPRLLMEWDVSGHLQGDAASECAKAVKEELLRAPKDVAPHKKYAEFARRFLRDEGAVEVLEGAREVAPKDVEVLWLLAEAAGRKNEREKAIAALEAALPLLETPVTVEGRAVTKQDALLELARRHADAQKVKDTLARIDLKSSDATGLLAIEVGDEYGRIDEHDLAIASYMRARELGLRPHFKIGRLYEKKKDYYEALRWYNRDTAEGSTGDAWGEGQVVAPQPVPTEPEDPANPPKEREPVNGKEARERLLKKLGPDFVIDKFLEQKFDPLSDAERARVARAIEQFRSEEMSEREAGEEELRKIGPRAAPHLRDLLRAEDREVRARTRGIVAEWAEPK